MSSLAMILGVIFCLYWVAQLVFVRQHLRWTYTPQPSDARDIARSVSVIHPIKDLDFELQKNLDSWLSQDYGGPIEHIFSFQDADDPALPVVRGLPARHPQAHIKILVNPLIPGLNGKISNMVHGLKAAAHDVMVFGDSDTRVQPDFLVKMVRPLADEKVGATSCGQINLGGRDFWTRFFTYLQNCETDFYWAFFAWLGLNVGITGAAFAMSRDLIEKIGGLQRFGGSLLEDTFLGNQLYRQNLRIVLGPFIECHVDRLEKDKTFNYFKRVSVGIRRHIPLETLGYGFMLSWYWVLLLAALVVQDYALLWLCLVLMGCRTAAGLLQRLVTKDRIFPVDVVLPLLFDLLMAFYLLFPFKSPYVTWRGIRYRVSVDGNIKEVSRTPP
ncbi:MAG: glycosyltransferase [Syntrophobacterales bacterium]